MVKNISEKMSKIHEQKQQPAKASGSTSSTSPAGKRKYKGVRMRSWGSWVSEIRAPNQKTRIWLGSYSTAEAAARAYDAALLCLKGSSANLNFPLTTSSSYKKDVVLSPKSIQRVAAAAAAAAATNTTTTTTTTFVNDNNALAIATAAAAAAPDNDLSSSSSSSSSVVSSPSDQVDDDVSLMVGSLEGPCVMSDHHHHSYDVHNNNNNHHHHQQQQMAMMEPWYSFDDYSPKYVDDHHNQMMFMINGEASFLFDPQMLVEDPYEESDIRLWSFC